MISTEHYKPYRITSIFPRQPIKGVYVTPRMRLSGFYNHTGALTKSTQTIALSHSNDSNKVACLNISFASLRKRKESLLWTALHHWLWLLTKTGVPLIIAISPHRLFREILEIIDEPLQTEQVEVVNTEKKLSKEWASSSKEFESHISQSQFHRYIVKSNIF